MAIQNEPVGSVYGRVPDGTPYECGHCGRTCSEGPALYAFHVKHCIEEHIARLQRTGYHYAIDMVDPRPQKQYRKVILPVETRPYVRSGKYSQKIQNPR